jgi:hypothetical protein
MNENKLHTKACLSAAIICAVQNARDEEGMTDFDFRILVQENRPLEWADEYLSTGTATCLCPVEEEYDDWEDDEEERKACPVCSGPVGEDNLGWRTCPSCHWEETLPTELETYRGGQR